jgi:uncharacterized C2H2 Zn-finger protein
MSEFTCKACQKEFDTEEFPFGDDVTCPHCGAVFGTDWDYVDEEAGMAAWLLSQKTPTD